MRLSKKRTVLAALALIVPVSGLIRVGRASESLFLPSEASLRPGTSAPAGSFNAQSCGRSGCHPQAVAEWESSSHRHSGLDNPWYRATLEETRAAVGAVPSRWCAGCHTPALLLSGLADRPPAETVARAEGRAGVSCTVCHSISHAKGVTGQAAFELSPPPALRVSRRNAEAHRRQLSSPALQGEAASDTCSTCHRGSVDTPVGGHGWLSVLDDYSPWQASDASGRSVPRTSDPVEPRGCVDCHMPRVRSRDAGNRDGWARSHRFAAANTALPALRGDRAQLQAVTDFLRSGQVAVDIFAMIQGSGATFDFRAPLNRVSASLRRETSTRFDVLVRNTGVGHLFPGGKQDLHDCWLELKAVDENGRVLFWSGKADEGGPVAVEAHDFGVTWIDEKGEPVENHRIWAARVPVNPQLVEPGGAQMVLYDIVLPAESGERVTLTARLHYRPVSWELTQWAFARLGNPGAPRPPRLPIVTLAEDSVTLPVVPADAPPPEPAQPVPVASDYARWNSYGFAQIVQGNMRGARESFLRAVELKPDFTAGVANFGRAVMLANGDLPAARARLEEALRLDPGFLRTRLVLGQLEKQEGRYDLAIGHLSAVIARYPRDFEARRELGSTFFLSRDFERALQEIQAALAINPEDSGAHFLAMQILSALRQPDRAKAEMVLFTRYRRDPGANLFMRDYFQKYEEGNFEMGRHQHRSLPPEELVKRPETRE
ncbi:MAG: tetratricopeptide repeat protein [Acidobacteriota bacterium]